jgi:AhpD family alkylhydroperoxidase
MLTSMDQECVMPTEFLSYAGFQRVAPSAHTALLALGKSVDDAGLDKALTELLKVRVSQINGCAFCTQYHLTVARRIGVLAAKLDLVAVWQDAGGFTRRERAALAWAEHLTAMGQSHVPDQAYEQLRLEFSAEEAVHLTVAIANITAWNRIAGALHFAPLHG